MTRFFLVGGLGRTRPAAGGCYALCAPSLPSGSLGHPVTPTFARPDAMTFERLMQDTAKAIDAWIASRL